MSENKLFIGNSRLTTSQKEIKGELVTFDNENYYKISNYDAMRSFFMSIVSDSDHWMFISSNGGLSAGRKNAEHALFPYYTDDKITESSEITGSKSIFIVDDGERKSLWEPFSIRNKGIYNTQNNLYKNSYGNRIIFEEVNEDLGLTFRYQWNNSDAYGFVKKSRLINHAEKSLEVSFLDGIQNIVPFGVGSTIQNQSSNLVDAYKKNELEAKSGLGIYALSAIIVDKAEPSEALKATIVYALGLGNKKHLVSSLQLADFRKGKNLEQETDVRAEKGAYFVNTTITLSESEEKEWMIVANIDQDHSNVAAITASLQNDSDFEKKVLQDIHEGTKNLIQLTAAADGLQSTADNFRDNRHFSNTLFNIMRGGIFDNNYQIEKWDFKNYLQKANKQTFEACASVIEQLPDTFSLSHLRKLTDEVTDSNFKRLSIEYMPLKFSRRHGDPSRPWNRFSINTRNEEDGSKVLDYEGNWRDIFQNWEALSYSFPEFTESMIHKFLNASTFDGYNPYRVTKDGFDWEAIEEDDPWSYIGYWGDHQIIYLLKFLEFIEKETPGKLATYFNQDIFVYANVPYKIKSYNEILRNPKDTIEFDESLDHKIRVEREKLGADGALLGAIDNSIFKVNFIEKILATVLSKMSNFIPEGGIWMNTQRPEWNDANNALVGNGVSMVTLYYLRRFLTFFNGILEHQSVTNINVSEEMVLFFNAVKKTLDSSKGILNDDILDSDRKKVMDGLGEAGNEFRNSIYDKSFSGKKKQISLQEIKSFLKTAISYLEQSIDANKRGDHMYHAYNLMTVKNDKEVGISYLEEMLEGQVAVLSSGYLSPSQSLKVLDGLKDSALFREDQYSYLLYPNKQLNRFTQKNTIPEKVVAKSELIKVLIGDNNAKIVKKDVEGKVHFNGNFNNAGSLENALDDLKGSKYEALVKKERDVLFKAFEEVFNHKAFTGRSGTFYGYEGLGSIYWHMVSKLQLAVQECCLDAIQGDAGAEVVGRLLAHYYEINEGIGVHKSPSLYGAFPTDPYSHTPGGKGAQQPGMTGQVKEDIISRFGELGVFLRNGQLTFHPVMLRKDEFLLDSKDFEYVDINQKEQTIHLEKGSLCFTFCQIPMVYELADKEEVLVKFNDSSTTVFQKLELDKKTSKKVFRRTGEVMEIRIQLKEKNLR
ncbi:hypothetical protein [Maribacter aestuarii]|uniref:hypothetical protein n=1 Tax=Maribacter aestuarii TaxID=1130723 RepID=UPI0025A53540|nr:hypothetical protein [Maribacter aestuarii]